jgi:hypothetical protein
VALCAANFSQVKWVKVPPASVCHDGIHPAGLQQLVEARRKIPGVGREQRKLAIQRPANGGMHIEMTTVDRPAASAAR